MKQALSLSAILATLVYGESSQNSTNWAVLVAGSNGYYNYRHQADIAHSHQILHKLGGFPKENIIVMMYNDVVNASDNPFPGQLFNEPGGSDVYGDIEISYSGDQVTAENFLNVLKGKKHHEEGRPVLESGPNDNVFIYYSDHGATGLVAMPVGDPLYAKDLIEALNYMYENKMYSQLVFYLEACESGSMFEGILSNTTNVFATTAATSDQPSYAYYYNDTLQTYMADEYSIRWMQDSTNNWDAYESLIDQFKDVAAIVNESQPQKYGDMSFDKEPIEDFEAFEDRPYDNIGYGNGDSLEYLMKSIVGLEKQRLNAVPRRYYDEWVPSKDAVSSRDVKLAVLQHKYLAAKDDESKIYAAKMVEEEIEYRLSVDVLFELVIEFVIINNDVNDVEIDTMRQEYIMIAIKYGHIRPEMINYDCLKRAYSEYEANCERFGDYSLKYVNTLVNLCEMFNGNYTIIKDAFENLC